VVTGFDVVAFTRDYETWLGTRIPLVGRDVQAKHAAMSGSVFRFLRGTYYLWLRRVADLVPGLVDRPAVPLVGDLHVENFGTWTDHDGVRRWGVNDFDELGHGSYRLDLVRLVTSALLAPGVQLGLDPLCHLLLSHWQTAVPSVAVAVDTDPARHLRALMPAPKPAKDYYAALRAGQSTDPPAVPDSVRSALHATVGPAWQPTWHARQAGTGSLGHPRLAAVGRDAAGHWQSREAKLLGPQTCTWHRAGVGPVVDEALYDTVLDAMRGPHPSLRVEGWQVRRLAPDIVRVDLSGLAVHDTERVIRSMAQAMVDVHGLRPAALAAARADSTEPGWLPAAVATMAADTRACHHRWSS